MGTDKDTYIVHSGWVKNANILHVATYLCCRAVYSIFIIKKKTEKNVYMLFD